MLEEHESGCLAESILHHYATLQEKYNLELSSGPVMDSDGIDITIELLDLSFTDVVNFITLIKNYYQIEVALRDKVDDDQGKALEAINDGSFADQPDFFGKSFCLNPGYRVPHSNGSIRREEGGVVTYDPIPRMFSVDSDDEESFEAFIECILNMDIYSDAGTHSIRFWFDAFEEEYEYAGFVKYLKKLVDLTQAKNFFVYYDWVGIPSFGTGCTPLENKYLMFSHVDETFQSVLKTKDG